MIEAMYGDWGLYCREAHRAFAGTMFGVVVGSCVMIRRSAYDKIGTLDERIQAADGDLDYTLKKREQEFADVRRCMVVGTTFVHHFIRAMIMSKREPSACAHEQWSIDRKWDEAEQARLWCKSEEFSNQSSLARSLKRHLIKPIKKLFQELGRATAGRRPCTKPQGIVEEYCEKFQTMGMAELRSRPSN